MNSSFLDKSHGFLNRKSVSHSVERRVNNGVVPASSSSQVSIGVISAAKSAPKLDPPLTFQLAAPPSSTIAIGSSESLLVSSAKAQAGERNKNAMHSDFMDVQSYHAGPGSTVLMADSERNLASLGPDAFPSCPLRKSHLLTKWLADRGALPQKSLEEDYASYLAGIFRTLPFGAGLAHQGARETPAMEAGLGDHVWSRREIVALTPSEMAGAA
jgi:hypothetical protein